jgi:nucleoside phosphorylase
VVFTALAVEHKAAGSHLRDLQEERHPKGTVYHRGRLGESEAAWEVLLVRVGHGNNPAAVEAERAIAHFQPDVVLFVGIAGGLKDVEVGDVVAADKIYGYESGKALRTFQPRPDVGSSSYGLVQRAMAEEGSGRWRAAILGPRVEREPKAKVGPIAAGEKVVADRRSLVHRFLRSQYGDALAVEMEGRGFLHAAYANETSALVVRGISDVVEGKNASDEDERQDIAARHAAAFAFALTSLERSVSGGSSIGREHPHQLGVHQPASGPLPRPSPAAPRPSQLGPPSSALTSSPRSALTSERHACLRY